MHALYSTRDKKREAGRGSGWYTYAAFINNTRSFEPFLEKVRIAEEDWERNAKDDILETE